MSEDSEEIGFVAFKCSLCGFTTLKRHEWEEHMRMVADRKTRMKEQLDALDEQERETRRRRKELYQAMCGGGAP